MEMLARSETQSDDQFIAITVSVTQAAKILGVSEPTIYRLIDRRFLRILPGLRHKRITRRSIDAYCAGEAIDASPSRRFSRI
jgi:excisionase family DNA binding protein